MIGNDFWTKLKVTSEDIAFETSTYLVFAAPGVWRSKARMDTDRNLGEYVVVNRVYGTIEHTCNNLPTAIATANTLEDAMQSLNKGTEKHENVVSLVPKDRTT